MAASSEILDRRSQSSRVGGGGDEEEAAAPIRRELNFRDVFYGREEEILKLEGIFRRTAAGRSAVKYPNMVLVGGVSGAGKSTLVRKMHDHLHSLEEELFWIAGKFEEGQQQQTIDIDNLNLSDDDDEHSSTTTLSARNTLHPFAAIVAAFEDFCQNLEDEEPETIEEVKADILEALGQQGGLLTYMIPSLKKIIGEQEQVGSIGDSRPAELERFHLVFHNFLQALASEVRTVVLVLDDVQRADDSSLDLLKALMTSDLKHVLFIGTYRSNEVNENEEHRFTKWVNSILELQAQRQPEKSTTVTMMELSAMDLETINTLVSRALDLQPDDTRSVAHIIYTKTEGNIFYAIQYLMFLHEKELLWFDATKGCWGWDECAIREEAAVSTTLIDFMRDKMFHSKVAPKILPVAACLGAKFSQETLAMILGDIAKIEPLNHVLKVDPDKVQDLLKLCWKEGFIETLGNKNYSFTHDKMQEAALMLHPVKTMQQIRHQAGGTLFRKLSAEELEEKLFVIVNLLNTSQKCSVAPFEIAQLNLQAAKKSKQMAAFWSAATYIESALFFLPSQPSEETKEAHRAFLLDVCSLGAEIEGAIGRLGRMQEYCDRVIESRFKYTVFELLRVQNVWIDCNANNGGKMDVALEYCLDVLQELGCSFPKTTVGKGFKSVASVLQSKAPKNIPKLDDINSIALMTDPAKVEAMRLLDRAATYSYMEENQMVFTLCTTRMARWTVRYGICEKSPAAYALLGLVLMHVLGDFKAGTWYGDLAVAMIERLQILSLEDESLRATLTQSRSRATFLANAFTLYWTRRLQDYRGELYEGYQAGMRVGDVESAFWNIYFHIGVKFAAGAPLATLETLCRTHIAEMIALRREEPEAFTRIAWQGFLNLMKYSPEEGTTELSGSAMREADCMTKLGVWQSKLIPHLFGHMKSVVCAYFGDYEQGAKLAVERGDSFLAAAPGQMFSITDPFMRGVCLYGAACSNPSKQRSYRQHAQKCRATLKSWVKKGVPPAVHQLKLLDAEHEACNGKKESAKELYQQACLAATEGGFTQDAALANERFAIFLLSSTSKEDTGQAKQILIESLNLYEKWGANAKVDKLLAEYPDLVSSRGLASIPLRTSIVSVPAASKEMSSPHPSRSSHI